jgi:hypothetical protein
MFVQQHTELNVAGTRKQATHLILGSSPNMEARGSFERSVYINSRHAIAYQKVSVFRMGLK